VPIRDIDQELPGNVDHLFIDDDDDDDDDSDYSYHSINDDQGAVNSDDKLTSSFELSSKLSYDDNLDDNSNDEAGLLNETEENDDDDIADACLLNENEENDVDDSTDDDIADNENSISSSEPKQRRPRVETEYNKSRPQRQNAGAGVDRLSPRFGVKRIINHVR